MKKGTLSLSILLASGLAFTSPPGPETVATGGHRVLFLLRDGEVRAKGAGGVSSQQLLDAAAAIRFPARSLVVGRRHQAVLLSSGAVLQWGEVGGTSIRLPDVVPDLLDVKEIASGADHILALGADGSVWAWGSNAYGQLGDGTGSRAQPLRVGHTALITTVAAGDGHSLALDASGRVWAWGRNTEGQLGSGESDNSPEPRPIEQLADVVAIAAGARHSLAVDSGGRVWAWGDNSSGQVAGVASRIWAFPVRVDGLPPMVQVAGGDGHSIALSQDGAVWAWGANAHGQLGNGSRSVPRRRIRVFGPAKISRIFAGAALSLATSHDGTIWGWGENGDGQLPDGGEATDRLSPTILDPRATNRVATPALVLRDGGPGSVLVDVQCETPGTTIRFTIDGSTPTPDAAVYGRPFAVDNGTAIKVRAWKAGLLPSRIRNVEARAIVGEAPAWGKADRATPGPDSSTGAKAATEAAALLARTALFVVGNATLNASDAAIQTRLQNLGFTVTVKAGSAALASDAMGKTVVVISATNAAPNTIGTTFQATTVPVVTWASSVYADMKMVGLGSAGIAANQTQISIVNAAHPLAAAYGTGPRVVTTLASTFNWGAPSTNAARIATILGNTTQFCLFGYEKNAAMVGVNAPARRVGLFLGDTTAVVLNPNGNAFFDTAIKWATNTTPVVNAGPDQAITWPSSAKLSSTVSDDGFVLPIKTTWTKVSGPGAVVFANANAPTTTADFSVAGTYVLQATASDGDMSSTDQITITAAPGNQAPLVNAGADRSTTLSAGTSLTGTMTDDGRPNPPGAVTVLWQVVSGASTAVQFGSPSALATTATFPVAGTYVLRLKASDGAMTSVDDVVVTVTTTNPAKVATPTFTPNGGAFLGPQPVQIACATPGATIRYTIDGSEPNAFSSSYTIAISVAASTVLKAKAFLPGSLDSDTGVAVFKLPIVLTRQEYGAFDPIFTSMAVNSSATRIYLGGRGYDLQRRNLGVLRANASGVIAGSPQYYPIAASLLPPGQNETVTAVVVNEPKRKLYLAREVTPLPLARTDNLTVYDLDASGDPIGAPRIYPGGTLRGSAWSLALHPTLPVLYLGGWGNAEVYAYSLDASGEPVGTPAEIALGTGALAGIIDMAVSPTGNKLYLGTYPNSLEVVGLGGQGLPTAGTLRIFAAGREPGNPSDTYFRFRYTPGAVYRRQQFEFGFTNGSDPISRPLSIWSLGADGYPVGAPTVQSTLTGTDVAADVANARLWFAADSFTGAQVDGVKLMRFPSNNVTPATGVVAATGLRRRGVLMEVAGNGTPVLLTQTAASAVTDVTNDYRLRVTVLSAQRVSGAFVQPGELLPAWIEGKDTLGFISMGNLTINQPSAWRVLDPHLAGQAGQVPIDVVVGYQYDFIDTTNSLKFLRVQIEVAKGNPQAGGTLMRSVIEEVQGGVAFALIPGYSYLPLSEHSSAIELLSEHTQKYLSKAQQVAPAGGARPQLFTVGCSQLLGFQGHRGQLRSSAKTAGLLGCNAIDAYSWGKLAPTEIDTELDAAGLNRRTLAVYRPGNPPSSFDYEPALSPTNLAPWAATFTDPANTSSVQAKNGGSPSDVVDFKLTDEPAWVYPDEINRVRADATMLAAFQSWLQGKGFTPATFGETAWSAVLPIDKTGAVSLPKRRLFYWTMRFFVEATTRGHKNAQDALEAQFGRPLTADVNWNNWLNKWYSPSPLFSSGQWGSFDWFTSGRMSAHTLWSEDWFLDRSAQTWSLWGDALRSAASLGNRGFSGYVVGQMGGHHPEGASYKILSLLGHGAKTVDIYCFGPEPLFPGNCWSDNFAWYGPMAKALTRVAQAESLLYPGVPERGKVAIQAPGRSALWETNFQLGTMNYYEAESRALHAALIHAGYAVDFVDDTELAAGPSQYKVIYLLEPNTMAAAQTALANWVQTGGTLVAMPGAATADEYGEPTTLLDVTLGVSGRTRLGDLLPGAFDPPAVVGSASHVLTVMNTAFGQSGSVYGPSQPLTTTTASVMAQLDGATGITMNVRGTGKAYAYGFFPAWQYWITPDRRNPQRLPQGWGARERTWATAPAASVAKPVEVNVPGVEAIRLNSSQGVAIVLLNWPDQPIANLQVIVHNAAGFGRATSVERGTLASTVVGGDVTVSLPIANVDVLMLRP